jgi:hypothetical protein
MVGRTSLYWLGHVKQMCDSLDIYWDAGRSERREESLNNLSAVADVLLTLGRHVCFFGCYLRHTAGRSFGFSKEISESEGRKMFGALLTGK